jgi:hypothetical protein
MADNKRRGQKRSKTNKKNAARKPIFDCTGKAVESTKRIWHAVSRTAWRVQKFIYKGVSTP